MRKVLFVQPTLQPPGGANTVAAWMLEALRREYAISVLTWEPVDVASINRYYGTSLSASDFRAYCAPRLLRRLFALDPDPHSIQGWSLLMRLCKMIKDRYDVVVSANDEVDMGRRGIQYIHYPWLYTLYRRLYPAVGPLASRTPWRAILQRYRPWRLVSGFSFERVKNNLTLTNSNWTAAKVREFYGIPAVTVYPPVPGDFRPVAWSEREDGFVCIGRISAFKRFERVIEIVAAVRSRGHDVHLHVVGSRLSKAADQRYYQRIRQQAEEHASWVHLDEHVPRDDLVRLICTHKYGLHGQAEEHFGIVIAEMVRGGCIVFVPRFGGQVEIVGPDERLLFDTDEEAVAKITRVIDDHGEQEALRDYLSSRKDLFSTERFMTEISKIVRDFADNSTCC